VISTGEESSRATATPEAGNAGPRIGPVVISEIHYHPATGTNEFVALRNITESAVELFDPLRPTNTWRVNGLGFVIPSHVTLSANGLLLIVGGDPETFRAQYGVPAGVIILGPFVGNIQDSGERLELQRPDVPGTNGVPYITVDEVRYNDRAPWPPGQRGRRQPGVARLRLAGTCRGRPPAPTSCRPGAAHHVQPQSRPSSPIRA
jgi:hypothetical protein